MSPLSGCHHSDDGGSKLLRNIGQYLRDYMVQHPRRQPFSYSICSSLQIGPNEPMVMRMFNVNILIHHCNFEGTTIFLINNTVFSTIKIIHISFDEQFS
jgi:hypothetical protein